ncbi:MAG TPA: hypothetical protein VKB58_10410 [Terriglobales bacterium]|nr:hypothetical protein [Terriglobales bacterium]
MPRNRSPRPRVHIVLIPGFAGFDALGQLEYYAGVTPQFQRWQQLSGNNRDDLVLHYFDNFPTAAVRTRAARLRSYLAKRIARGDFAENDSLVLIGHSTGGLDIRKLVWELNESRDHQYPVDGATAADPAVPAETILRMIQKIVFLSVPQSGTNIADWVRSPRVGRELVIAELRASVGASQVPLLDHVQQWISDRAANATRLGFVLALRDALAEAEADTSRDPMCVALSQAAASELQLWLRHIATDFSVIDDLAAGDASTDKESPAHFSASARAREIARWQRDAIKTRSYATIGARPFSFDSGRAAPTWDLINPLTYPDLTRRANPAPDTDIVYRVCYRACAGGPFTAPAEQPVPKPFLVDSRNLPHLEVWDNDGIVNTASMLWPDKDETLLVYADHMDIVGHFRPVDAMADCGQRKYQAYDLLKSGCRFDLPSFEKVWSDIFDFCAS